MMFNYKAEYLFYQSCSVTLQIILSYDKLINQPALLKMAIWYITEIYILILQLSLVDLFAFTRSQLITFLSPFPIYQKKEQRCVEFRYFSLISFILSHSHSRASKEFWFMLILETLQNLTFYNPLLVLNFVFPPRNFIYGNISYIQRLQRFAKFIHSKIKYIFKIFSLKKNL